VIKYKQELLSQSEEEVTPLAELEWEESGHPTEPLHIAWESYFELEDRGQLKFFTARKDDLLVGYFVVVVIMPLTAKGDLMGVYDAVYVHKDYRKSTVGKRLFKYVETCMKEDGVYRVLASSSKKNPIGNFLTRMGYNEVETKYEKVL
jgi:GNAT superfamily N-acetyltransferase|tara:strand:- start:292 stop:735 length:444 start_codon:yes stop_codon:yes gene_type:complete